MLGSLWEIPDGIGLNSTSVQRKVKGENARLYQPPSSVTDRYGHSFSLPDEETAQKYRQECNPAAHGSSGPLKTSYPQFIMEPEIPFHQVHGLSLL